MLNFRKLRQDFSSTILKEGKDSFERGDVLSAKILRLDSDSVRLSCRVQGAFENIYECEIEIDRTESVAVDSNCDCTYTYDCLHISAFLYYLEKNLDEILVAYAKEADLEECDHEEKEKLQEAFKEAETKDKVRRSSEHQKELLREYRGAAIELGHSPFFLPPEHLEEEKAELLVIFQIAGKKVPELQIALRLPNRSKPLWIPNVKAFLDAVRYREPIYISSKRYYVTATSFDLPSREILTMIINHAHFVGGGEERYLRVARIDFETLGMMLARAFDLMKGKALMGEVQPLPCLYCGNLEEPFCYSTAPVHIRATLAYLESPIPNLLLEPTLLIEEEEISVDEVLMFESSRPGLIYKQTYFRFQPQIRRTHLRGLEGVRDVTIPKPLFGTFIENALPVLRQYAEVTNPELIEQFVTLPYVCEMKGRCVMSYLDGELEAEFFFLYDEVEIPAATSKLSFEHVVSFVDEKGILARNLVKEREMLESLFQDFIFDAKEGVFRSKSEKKIVEFMTEVIPRFEDQVDFECPENLSDQFLYDETQFEMQFKESDRIDAYQVELKVDGELKGTSVDLLWECVASKRRFIELKGKRSSGKIPRILVLDLETIAPIIQLFDEIGLKKLDNHIDFRPLWSLTSVHADVFKELPVKYTMSKPLRAIQKQILGESVMKAMVVPKQIQATLRNYQLEGVHWLERLRRMHLNGILADDMGLGKTLQAIIAITQSKQENSAHQALIVCPTSLVYNWKEEFHKFNPNLSVLVVDGIPSHRRKRLKEVRNYDVVVTSYNLLQKDVEVYKEIAFDYLILDEAQHIKNRSTRNAKSVKQVPAVHRLILTGTPIENSLDELWSLFDFLMPGLLSTYDRFVEKYIRPPSQKDSLTSLRKKVSPFILRRMKEDVLDDLPPVSEILYHCHLSDTQMELYQSFAASAKEELSKLVKKEGFDKIHIHVLATLTRLKQICCHPAIFAKEKAEEGDSAKYDMLMELIPTLIEGGHKSVIFSQYTKMLTIMREDLEQKGIPFAYLDGSSKNRLKIVNEFNENPDVPLFLVSLKAGGSGLNLVGADTVIHYDMWWNPAVENQATDRVHRLGQKKSVSSYKLITLNTIEEKILNLQNRKKGLVKKVINSDDEAIAKLTWEEVLELLQT